MQLVETFMKPRLYVRKLFQYFDLWEEEVLPPAFLLKIISKLLVGMSYGEVHQLFKNELNAPLELRVDHVDGTLIDCLAVSHREDLRWIEKLLSLYDTQGLTYDDSMTKEQLDEYIKEGILPLQEIDEIQLRENWRWNQRSTFTPRDFIMCFENSSNDSKDSLKRCFEFIFESEAMITMPVGNICNKLQLFGIRIPRARMTEMANGNSSLTSEELTDLIDSHVDLFEVPHRFVKVLNEYIPPDT